MEYAFAKQLNLATAALENKSGQFALPTEDGTAKAIATIKLSEDLRGSNADPDCAEMGFDAGASNGLGVRLRSASRGDRQKGDRRAR